MKKKLVSGLLVMAMTGSLLAGCGNGGSDGGSSAASSDSGSTEAASDDGAAAETEAASDDGAAETGSKDGSYDLTLYTINSTDEDFPRSEERRCRERVF